MIDQTQIQYFLGAYTPQGYHSLYSELLPPHKAKSIYLLKGGLPQATDSLLRQLDSEAQARNYPTEQILSTANPNTLDALVIPSLQTAILDATAPHSLEPTNTGLIEHFINLDPCYNTQALQSIRDPLLTASQKYREANARILPCLTTAGELRETILNVVTTEKLTEKLTKRAKGILNREIKPKKSSPEIGTITQRFLSATTSQGRLSLHPTATLQATKIFQLWDSYHIAHALLLPLMTGAVNRGYHVTACLSPANPQRLEHLIIPELSLAFLTASPAQPIQTETDRKIRLETMIDSGLLKQNRARLRTYRKMYQALLDEVILILADNNSLQENLQALYQPHFNDSTLSQITKSLGEEIFQDKST